MPRIALGLEYDGTDFVGWQTQREGRSVQSVLNAAISEVADEPVQAHGAGRTDAGVHAACQVAHFDTAAIRTERQWLLGLNSNLPDDVAALWVAEVPSEFDARRSAAARTYRYRICTRATRSALSRRTAWWRRGPIDCAAMTAAAVYWLGERDFSTFRAANCQSKTPMRRLTAVRIGRNGSTVTLEFSANAFLYHMVRNLVGALVEIGAGRQPAEWAGVLIDCRDRTQAAATAPACGLTLIDVAYPQAFDLPRAAT